MPRPFDDLSGRTFGRLTVIAFDHFDWHGISYYTCECACGVTKVVQRPNLVSGGTVSCSCYRDEQRHERCGEKHGRYKHGHATKENKATYEVWAYRNHIRKRSHVQNEINCAV